MHNLQSNLHDSWTVLRHGIHTRKHHEMIVFQDTPSLKVIIALKIHFQTQIHILHIQTLRGMLFIYLFCFCKI